MAKTKKEVLPFEGKTDIAVRNDRAGQGSENVSSDDMAIPRLKLLQAINDEVQPGNPVQVEGASAGMIMNSVSHDLYTSIYVVNLHFDKKVVVWRKRNKGGGLFGSYPTAAEATNALGEAGEDLTQYDISDNPTHLVMMLSEEGEPLGIALMDMPGSKLKVSKRWNTQINDQERAGVPRFNAVWRISAVVEQSQSGSFHNYKIDFVTNAPDEIYEAAVSAYDAFFPSAKAA